jgi:hypothetical protein
VSEVQDFFNDVMGAPIIDAVLDLWLVISHHKPSQARQQFKATVLLHVRIGVNVFDANSPGLVCPLPDFLQN